MREVLMLGAFLVAWVLLQSVVLPRFGVET